MTVEHIIPCICTKHPPTAADKSTYGMPILTVSDGLVSNKQFYSATCPVCRRGGLISSNSSYKALMRWNEMQEKLYAFEKREIIYYDDFEQYTDKYGNYLSEYKSTWDEL